MEHAMISRALYNSACKLPEYSRREFYEALMMHLFDDREPDCLSDTVAAMMEVVKATDLAKTTGDDGVHMNGWYRVKRVSAVSLIEPKIAVESAMPFD